MSSWGSSGNVGIGSGTPSSLLPGELIAEAWDAAMEPIVIGILQCSSCKKYSTYSWDVPEEEWKQKYFCPHCQSNFFSKVSRGRKNTKSKWSYEGNSLMEERSEISTPEKWKVAERLMGKAKLLKKEELLDEMLIRHVSFLNSKKQITKELSEDNVVGFSMSESQAPPLHTMLRGLK